MALSSRATCTTVAPMTTASLATTALPERRLSPAAAARLLGRWQHGGPAYAALADAVRRAVLDGSLPLGTRLPSERELAEHLGVSRTTTAAAYDRLRELGFLRTRRGSGSVTTVPERRTRPDGVLFSDPGARPDDEVDLTIAASAAPPELYGASLRALEALPRHLTGTGYSHLGLPELRAAVAERYTRRGTPTTPEEVLITSGAQHAIGLVMSTLVAPGERVVVEQPGYPNVLGALRNAGGRAVPVPVGPAGLDVDLLESTVRQSAPRLVHLTPDHHNPTGTSLDADGRARVRDVAARHRTLVLADETMTDLTLDGPAPDSFLGPAPGAGLMAVGSTSKSFWGGLRVGWLRAPRELVARLAQERPRADLGTAVLEQLIAVELLADAEEVLVGRRAALRHQRDVLCAAVARSTPWRADPPPGGLSVWADLGAPVSSALAALAPSHGVRVAPGPAFGVDGSFEDRLRLTFAAPPEQLERGVAGLAAAWRSLGVGATAGRPVEQGRRAVV